MNLANENNRRLFAGRRAVQIRKQHAAHAFSTIAAAVASLGSGSRCEVRTDWKLLQFLDEPMELIIASFQTAEHKAGLKFNLLDPNQRT